MNVILLSAGFGTRLKPITEQIPKCLAPIQGIPLLFLWLELLKRHPIEKILINTHYLNSLVKSAIDHSPYPHFYGSKLHLVHEPTLLGTAGTLHENYDLICENDTLVVHADNLSLFDLKEFVNAHKHRPAKTLMTMMSFTTSEPSKCGILKTDSEGILREFHEKVPNPPGNRANAAIYLLSPEFFKEFKRHHFGCDDLSTQVIPQMMGRIFTWHNSQFHEDIGSPETLNRVQKTFIFPQGLKPQTPNLEWWKNLIQNQPSPELARLLSSEPSKDSVK